MSIGRMVLENQFGEESINALRGSELPLVPVSLIVLISGTGVPTDGVTGLNTAEKGSLYLNKTNGAYYYNSGSAAVPAWTALGAGTTATLLTGFSAGAGTVSGADSVLQAFDKLVGNTQNLTVIGNLLTAFSAGAGTVSASDSILGAIQKLAGNTQNLTVIGNLLTGFSAGAGVVASTDSVLQGLQKLAGYQVQLINGTFTPTSETIASAGALSTTKMESLVNNGTAGSYAVTLAAPSSQDGQLKIIKFGTSTNTATLAMTNIVGPGFCTLTGVTTLTFTVTGDCAILMAVGAKWMLIGGNAIAS